jgi:tetratricopeptide (TPR) repeat protein
LRGAATRLLPAVLLGVLLATPVAADETPSNPELERIQARIQETRADTARALAAVGRAQMKDGLYDEAVRSFTRVSELAPDFPDIELSLGTAFFRAGRHLEARDALLRFREQKPENLDALLLLALARIELGELEAAARELEQVAVGRGPLQSLALVQLGRVRELLDDPEGARSALRRAIDASPAGPSAAQARNLLNRLDRRVEESRRYRLSASVAGLYDDNVVTPEIDASTGSEDGAAEFEASASYRIIDYRETEVDVGYDLFQSVYGDHSDFDLQTHTFSMLASRPFASFDASLGYGFTLATLGGDRLLDSHEVSPTLEFLPMPWWYAIVSPRVAWKDFDDNDRDAYQVAPRVLNFFFLPESAGYLLLGLGYEYENADARRFDYHGMRLRAGIHAPVQELFDVDLRYRFRLRDYTGETASIGKERLDKIHTAGVRLSRELGLGFEVQLEYEYENSDSNLSTADYDQNHVRLRFRWVL